MQWQELIAQAEAAEEGLSDRIVQSQEVKVTVATDEVVLETPSEQLGLTRWSLLQLCSRIRLPGGYISRLPADLQAANLAHGLTRVKEPWRLRVRGERVMGLLTPSYTPFGHAQVLRAAGQGLGKTRLSLLHHHLSDETLYVVASLDDYRHPIGRDPHGNPDWHQPTLCLVNSEVGRHGVSVDLGIWRQYCSNGLMGFEHQRTDRRHIHIKPERLATQIAVRVEAALEAAPGVFGRLKQARESELDFPEDIIEQMCKRARFSEALRERVLRQFAAEPEPTEFGIIQAFTAVARDLPPAERLGLEQFAGQVLAPRWQGVTW